MCLQLSNFIMLLPAKIILWEWQPYFITYSFHPFQSKLTVVLLKQFSQELFEPSWISRGLNSLDKSHSHRSFWDNLFPIFDSCWDGQKKISFLGTLWFILRCSVRHTLNLLKGLSGHCVFWPFHLSEVLAKDCIATYLVCSLCHAFSSDF